MIELKVPQAGESITEVQVGEWLKAVGDAVRRDENVVALETDKAALELPAPEDGVLAQILKPTGAMAKPGDVIGILAPPEKPAAPPEPAPEKPAAPKPAPQKPAVDTSPPLSPPTSPQGEKPHVTPLAARALAEHGLRPEEVQGTGPGGRITREDVQRRVEAAQPAAREGMGQRVNGSTEAPPQQAIDTLPPLTSPQAPQAEAGREEEAVPMSPLRRRVAERLVEAQQTAALLTTFNEVDMSAVIALREQHKETFRQRHGVKLGFMSFFVKASIEALKQFPQVNAEIRGQEIVYKNYYDIGIAIGGGKGLVVPVLRNAERMSFAEVERAIEDFARRAQENKLKLEELQGGTFTISNGGVYGSLLSTPIVNPPQSGILGMHAIQERPVARDGQVVIRPMMYIALTYDHRIVDGREAVSFLKRIKECVEEPARMLLEI